MKYLTKWFMTIITRIIAIKYSTKCLATVATSFFVIPAVIYYMGFPRDTFIGESGPVTAMRIAFTWGIPSILLQLSEYVRGSHLVVAVSSAAVAPPREPVSVHDLTERIRQASVIPPRRAPFVFGVPDSANVEAEPAEPADEGDEDGTTNLDGSRAPALEQTLPGDYAPYRDGEQTLAGVGPVDWQIEAALGVLLDEETDPGHSGTVRRDESEPSAVAV
jgi:hypothetical protein